MKGVSGTGRNLKATTASIEDVKKSITIHFIVLKNHLTNFILAVCWGALNKKMVKRADYTSAPSISHKG